MLDRASIQNLETKLRGRVVRPDDPDYDDARSIWNAMIDRRPGLVLRCESADDVIEAVRFAREHRLLVAVRGGGHNVAGTSVCDGGMMIDLSAMNAVHVDPKARIARVQGGATLADLDREAQAFGLATPGGVVSSTGVAGLTLGGGFGWLSRKYGLAADNLLSVELVTADGRLLTASPGEHPDLFWGLRGGGGNFGVATAFEFRLHEVGPEILFGPTVYRLEDAAGALRNHRAFATEAPRECCVWADLLTAPPLPFLPERYHGTKVLSFMQCYVGDIEAGQEVLAPLRSHGEPIGDAVGPIPYTAAQSMLDPMYVKGARNYWKSHNFNDLPEAALDAVIDMAAALPTPQSDILVCQLGGAINDLALDATAYPHRTTGFIITPGARWEHSKDDARCIEWLRAGSETIAAHASEGAYVNFIAEAEGRERDAFGPNYDRLVEVKNAYDPANMFRLNQNVRPTASA